MSEKSVYIVMRSDLKMRRGKEIAQACHAWSALDVKDEGPVICVRADSQDHLHELVREAMQHSVHHQLVMDQGRTEFGEPTLTCAAIGPVEKGRLPLLSAARLY